MENSGRKLAMLCLHGGKLTQQQCSVNPGLKNRSRNSHKQECACAVLEKQRTMELPHHEGRHDVHVENAKIILQAHMSACPTCSVCKDLCLQSVPGSKGRRPVVALLRGCVALCLALVMSCWA